MLIALNYVKIFRRLPCSHSWRSLLIQPKFIFLASYIWCEHYLFVPTFGFHAARVEFKNSRKVVHTNIKVPHKFKDARCFQLSSWREKIVEYLDFMQCVELKLEDSAYQY